MNESCVTYAEYFDYVEDRLVEEPCDRTFRHTKTFAEEHGLSFEKLAQILRETGSYCDCQVPYNSVRHIPDDAVIGQETFKTPEQLAIELGLYCHCRVNGKPVSFVDAVKAKLDGVEVEWHVPCGKDDPFAMARPSP